MPREIVPTIQTRIFKTTCKDSEKDNYNEKIEIPFNTDRSITFVGDLMMVGISLD